VDFHGEERRNNTHASTTDPEARLARKSGGHELKLAYCGNVLIENRNGLVVDTELVLCSGTAERDAARVAEYQSTRWQRDRSAHDKSRRLSGEPAQAETNRRSIRFAAAAYNLVRMRNLAVVLSA
jgi:hypothetical protein